MEALDLDLGNSSLTRENYFAIAEPEGNYYFAKVVSIGR